VSKPRRRTALVYFDQVLSADATQRLADALAVIFRERGTDQHDVAGISLQHVS
jgi:hypothetical protein